MTRLLPSTTDLLLGILRPALTGATVANLIPARMPLPFVLARRVGGSSTDPRFLDRAIVDVSTWADSDRAAEDLAEDARTALVLAWQQQTVVAGVGSIGRFIELEGPILLPSDDDPDGVYRYQATYEITGRPLPS
ncbi:hypothetical protein [Kitasatospora indigofera]|uniref:hypothetical protein n=1 Tax=Kitasatospora indigofera TaxID=67307 RepID=UPI00369A895F